MQAEVMRERSEENGQTGFSWLEGYSQITTLYNHHEQKSNSEYMICFRTLRTVGLQTDVNV